jgi:hypothetical protein
MLNGREAAGRVKSFIKVIVLNKLDDVENPNLHKQISLDLTAGIKIFLVLWDQIKEIVKESDFGIWDHEYVCIVRANPKNNKVEVAELNSRETDIKGYERWREYILKKSTSISKPEVDIPKFVKSYSG